MLGICYYGFAMTEQTYREAFDKAKSDLADAQTRKQRAAEELKKAEEDTVNLRRAVTILATLCGEDVEDSMGLTEAVRTIMRATKRWQTLANIREQVEQIGVSLDGLKNPDASVMSVLNRLVAGKELLVSVGRIGGAERDVKIWKQAPAPKPVTPELADDDIPF